VGGIERPSVPVEGPDPVGELPSPVSVGTITLFFAEGAGGGNPPSAGMGVAALGGAAVEVAEPQAIESSARTPRPPRTQGRSNDHVIHAT